MSRRNSPTLQAFHSAEERITGKRFCKTGKHRTDVAKFTNAAKPNECDPCAQRRRERKPTTRRFLR